MKNSSSTIKPITASNGDILTIDDLIASVDCADVDWEMARFAFSDENVKDELDICLLDFFKDQQSWQQVDKYYLEEYPCCEFHALIRVIERRAKNEWLNQAMMKGWEDVMYEDQYKSFSELNSFEKAVYQKSQARGFRLGYTEHKGNGQKKKNWITDIIMGGLPYEVTVCFVGKGPDVKDTKSNPWTSEKAFIHIEEGNSRTILRLYHE
ncbi:hypothetical protein [Fibrobacter sp. UWB5]|uniref:hypothetical protein n=1 Tax=Fibrobacter sp. UWB5 TaxID=1964360 RepID=UPI000B524430|nr:hypothetical protein [Fibrobacter sp. UWB5]OWV09980.1 hypothetical protein B7989_12195 [Fibrobacter sp. UWB5]